MDFFASNLKFRPCADEPIYDCRENCEMAIYRSTDINEVNAWLEKLSESGFKIIRKNEIDGNRFTLLEKDGLHITAYYTPCDSSLRVTAGENPVPDDGEPVCGGDCETVFYGFENDHTYIDCGMCLLVQCPDYSFFVVDSGHYFQFNDNDRIHKFMRDRTPRDRKIVVNGWFVSHAHSDHISKLMDFLRYNCDDVIIEGFYSNLIDPKYDIGNEWDVEEVLLSRKLFRQLDALSIPKYKLHSGMRFTVRNLSFNVLCTHEDIFPEKMPDYNDSSCALMMSVGGTKVFIPGDCSALASRVLEARYNNELKCDVVQVAHHGHSGLSTHAYELIGAKVAVFPITRIMFDEEYPKQEANRRLIELAEKYYITSDGTVCIPLPLDVDRITTLPDETFEDFAKIKNQWGYTYSDERQQELYGIYLSNGGNLEKEVLPVQREGFSLR